MTRFHLLIASLLLLLAPLLATATENNQARTIMEKVDARDDGDNQVSDMEMVLIDRRGSERARRLRSYSKDQGDDTLQLLTFTYPPDVAGTGLLTHDHDSPGTDDDQWLYLPALNRAKRIASSGKSGSFMGSDLSYADLTRRILDDYDYQLVKESEVDGKPVWVVEATPRSPEVIEETGYEKSLLLVRKDCFVVVRAVSWLKNGDLKYLDVKRLEQIDGIWVATELHMTTKRARETRHRTVLRLANVRFDQQLDANLFTVASLERGP